MKLYKGKLNYAQEWALPNILLFTGNPVKKNNGAIVMGAGAALQVRDTYVGVDVKLGQLITPQTRIAFVPLSQTQTVGWFKVKHHWRDNADINLIAESVIELTKIAKQRPELEFHLNYPGIGNGKLSREVVEPYLLSLPDNVSVYLA